MSDKSFDPWAGVPMKYTFNNTSARLNKLSGDDFIEEILWMMTVLEDFPEARADLAKFRVDKKKS